MKPFRSLFVLLGAAGALALGGCASTAPRSADHTFGSPRATAETKSESVRRDRPGLGTGWGENRDSETYRTNFVRANGDRPAATDRAFYNDRAGVEAMLAYEGGGRRRSGMTRLTDGISLGLKNSSGGWYDSYAANGRTFFVGDRGARYEIVVHNDTNETREFVLSVDGLDVMDGRSASYSKRGYIVDPGDTLNVDGFRTSVSTVAAFRFSSVSQSYASLRHGNTRNVGVIGIAAFSERRVYARPPSDGEAVKRRDANPFPGRRWAQPRE